MVVDRAVDRFDDAGDEIDDRVRRVELALLLRVLRLDGERLKVVFVHAPDEVAVRKVFMRDLADFVDDLLEVVRRDFGAREDFLRKRALKRVVADFKPVEDAVEIDIELVVGLVIGNRLPAAILGKEEAPLRAVARGIIHLLFEEFARVALREKFLPDLLAAKRELLADEAEEHERQHEIALVGDTRLAAQQIAAVEEDILESQFLGLGRFLHSVFRFSSRAQPKSSRPTPCIKRERIFFSMHSTEARPKAHLEYTEKENAPP